MTDPRQEDRERLAARPIVATHSDECCEGCGKRIVKGEPIDQHRGHWIHAAEPDSVWTCRDDLDAKLAEIDQGRAEGTSRVTEEGAVAMRREAFTVEIAYDVWPGAVSREALFSAVAEALPNIIDDGTGTEGACLVEMRELGGVA